MYLCNKSLFLYSFLICNKNVTCSHSRKERSFMKTKNYWSLASADIISELGSGPDGLSSNRARQLLLEKGENVLDEQKPDSIIKVFFSQFCDLLIVILLICCTYFYVFR